MKKLDSNVISIPFKINNEGAGIAFSVHLEYLDDKSKPKGIYHIATSIQGNHNNGYDVLGVREPIDTDVLQIGKQTEFCLYVVSIDDSSNEIHPTTDIRWEFNILFCDIQGRKYSQTYSLYTSTQNNKIVIVNSYMPQLRK